MKLHSLPPLGEGSGKGASNTKQIHLTNKFMIMEITTPTETFEEVITATKYLPCISLLMPFNPKMGLKQEIDYKLKVAADQIEKDIKKNYTSEKALPVLQKLHHALNNINYNTHKQSVAIFISPIIEKVYYLDISVEEKIIIDDSFEIRDLIYSKKEIHKYLLVVLSNNWTKIFLGNTKHFIRVTLNVPDNIEAYKNDIGEKIANFSDENKRKEILMDKFLRHTDNGLSILLQSYNLPLFVMGTPKILGHFKSISHNIKKVIDYIPGNYEDNTESAFQKTMKPYLADWKNILQKKLLNQIDEAMGNKRLAIGMNAVWKAAEQKRGKLLVVEKNYLYPAQQSDMPEKIFKKDDFNDNAFFIKDAVDDVIEKVLACGGDVEFVDEGILSQYQKIVLIQFYAV